MACALTVIFDVNFMQKNASEPEVNLTKNLIGVIGGQVDPPVGVPEPETLGLLAAGLLGLGLTRRRRD